MLGALLWLALQTSVQISDIAELGCQGPGCLTLSDVASLPSDSLPAGCQLQMLAVQGVTHASEPVVICEEPAQPAPVPGPSDSKVPRSTRPTTPVVRSAQSAKPALVSL